MKPPTIVTARRPRLHKPPAAAEAMLLTMHIVRMEAQQVGDWMSPEEHRQRGDAADALFRELVRRANGLIAFPLLSRWSPRVAAGRRDHARINMYEDYEVRYRTENWNVSRKQLATAVHDVGVTADDVAESWASPNPDNEVDLQN